MQVFVADAIENQAQAFLRAWFAARQVVQTLNFNRFQQEGLSASQFILLTLLGEGAAASPAELARHLNVDVTTTMRTAQSLVARGLVWRRRDPEDRRRTTLGLTGAGRAVHGRMREDFVAHVSAAFARMPAARRTALVSGLEAFVAAADRRSG